MFPGRIARLVGAISAAIVTLVLRASAAIAEPYPGGDQKPPVVQGQQFFRHPSGGTADTGMKLLLWILLGMLFILAGLIFHRVSRDRAARTSR